jgi:hypothetical protein
VVKIELVSVTTKEIPKRELRVIVAPGIFARTSVAGYNKRNPKKGIESRKLSHQKPASNQCYNKRNPKKGIESCPPAGRGS